MRGRVAVARDRALRVVRILQSTIDRQWSLERAWSAESTQLARHERSGLREICSGSLRYLAHYDRLIEYVAPDVFDDTQLRLLAASTLYEQEHMRCKPSPRELEAQLSACCDALGAKHAARNSLLDACRTTLLSPAAKRRIHTPASLLSLPGWLHGLVQQSTPLKRYGRGMLERPDFLGLNIDPARASPAEYADNLSRGLGLEASVSSLSPQHGVVVHSRPREVGLLPGLGDGSVHVQDPAQQWACARLSPLGAGGRILDACAAPGGKTRALLHHQPAAAVVSLDRSAYKVERMRRSFAGNGAVTVLQGDVVEPAGWWDGVPFRAILLDAPCSGTGIMRARPEVKAQQTRESVAEMRRTQAKMLRALWPMLQPGGELLYTTCSLLRSENEDVISTFLRSQDDAALLPLPRPPSTDPEDYCVRPLGVLILPSRRHMGGFSALLQKSRGRGGGGSLAVLGRSAGSKARDAATGIPASAIAAAVSTSRCGGDEEDHAGAFVYQAEAALRRKRRIRKCDKRSSL